MKRVKKTVKAYELIKRCPGENAQIKDNKFSFKVFYDQLKFLF